MANRPKYLNAAGTLEDTDKQKLASAPAHAIIDIAGLTPGDDIAKKVQRFPFINIDPNQYEVEPMFKDVLRSTGAHEADPGPPAGATATDSSIAEHPRQTSSADYVDEIDDLLTALARATGQLMLAELSKQTVIEIAGDGAVWPDMPPTREEIAKELYLTVQAKTGSSGRPNAAAKLANIERAAPYIIQMPGINPEPLVQEYAQLLDIDMDKLFLAGLPSIMARNAAAGRPAVQGAGGKNDPNAQGGKGGANAPHSDVNEPGAQPAYPAPAPAGAASHQVA